MEDIVRNSSFIKATLSKPRSKQSDLINIYVEQLGLNADGRMKLTYRYKTKDQTKTVSTDQAIEWINDHLKNDFFFADFYTESFIHSLKQSKKGQSTWSKKKNDSIQSRTIHHDKQKQRPISQDADFLMKLGLASSNGLVYQHAQNKYKQINRYVELISHLLPKDLKNLDVVDMGSGKGYLTFALYQYLKDQGTEVDMQGIEMRKDLVDKCNGIAKQLRKEKLSFAEGNILEAEIGIKDMVIALHACDIATDMAIHKALLAEAKFIVLAPCCHKQVRKSMEVPSGLQPLLRHGILLERQAEMLTDSIRALILESYAYKTQIFEFISSEHTGKNVMITATKTSKSNPEALKQIQKLKETFGIREHYLEYLITTTPSL